MQRFFFFFPLCTRFEMPVLTELLRFEVPDSERMTVAVLPSPDWWGSDEPLEVELAPGSATGFKAVHKVRDGCFQARVKVPGKGLRIVWKASTPEESAWMLARWRQYPCSLRSPAKGRAARGEGSKREREAEARRTRRLLGGDSQPDSVLASPSAQTGCESRQQKAPKHMVAVDEPLHAAIVEASEPCASECVLCTGRKCVILTKLLSAHCQVRNLISESLSS